MERDLTSLAPGEGPTFRVIGGDVVTVKAATEDTGGSYSLFESTTPSQGGPPPHVHSREDEAFYILEGEYLFHVGDREIRATVGSYIWAPATSPTASATSGRRRARCG